MIKKNNKNNQKIKQKTTKKQKHKKAIETNKKGIKK